MRYKHKIFSRIIFVVVFVLAFLFKASMTDATAQNLVTFLSIVFGFHMTSIAIFYDASYTKKLHEHIDDELHKRGTHILVTYLRASSYCSIFSITYIIIFAIFASKNASGILTIEFSFLASYSVDVAMYINRFIISALFGVIGLSILYMLFLLNEIIDGLVEEAKG